jgi:hypothetical protein
MACPAILVSVAAGAEAGVGAGAETGDGVKVGAEVGGGVKVGAEVGVGEGVGAEVETEGVTDVGVGVVVEGTLLGASRSLSLL